MGGGGNFKALFPAVSKEEGSFNLHVLVLHIKQFIFYFLTRLHMHMAMTGTLIEGSFSHMLLQETLKNLKVVVILSVTVRIRDILWWT